MAKIESIKIRYPDKFGIKDKLRNGKTHSPEFLDLTLKSYELFSFLRNETLSITESLRTNQNVNILDHQILAAKKVKNKSQTILKEYLIDLADKNERERIGKNGRNYVRENYSVEKMASNYYNLFIGCD